MRVSLRRLRITMIAMMVLELILLTIFYIIAYLDPTLTLLFDIFFNITMAIFILAVSITQRSYRPHCLSSHCQWYMLLGCFVSPEIC